MRKILFLAAHVDDCEISAGGTISRLKSEGHYITVMSLSQQYEAGNLVHEFQKSMETLGVDVFHAEYFPTRYFQKHRQQILDRLYSMRNSFTDVFTHDPNDTHSDHAQTGLEAIRAFKTANLYVFKSPFNTGCMDENLFYEISRLDLDKKIAAIQCYTSQAGRPYMNNVVIESQAMTRGLQCGSTYAEAFKVIRMKY